MKKPASNSGLSRVKRFLLGIPEPQWVSDQFKFGTELHTAWLEKGKRELILTDDEEITLATMLLRLQESSLQEVVDHPDCQLEIDVEAKVFGVDVRGRLDIFNKKKKIIGDLKTTSCTSYKQFFYSAVKYDYFRQAYLYQKMTGVSNFYFIAVSKYPPYNVFTLNVADHPRQMYAAIQETKFLLYYYKKYYEN